MTKTYWNHFEMSPLPQKSTSYSYIIAIFDSHTCTVTPVCAWDICGSMKVDVQLEGTFTKYQSFRTVLKKVYH